MITSTSNIKVKRLVSLKKKKKLRDSEKVFLIEGPRMFREVPKSSLLEIYATRSFMEKEEESVKEKAASSGIMPEFLSDAVFEYVSDTKTPQGILCVVRQTEKSLGEVTGGDNPLLLVLDNIQDPGRDYRNYYEWGLCGRLQSEDDTFYDGIYIPDAVCVCEGIDGDNPSASAGRLLFFCGAS